MPRGSASLRLGGQDGDGVIGTFFGVLVFLLFLLFAVQVSSHLHATTVVTTAAFDAARLASASDVTDPGCGPPGPAALDRATDHLRGLLGGLAQDADVTWAGTTGTDVVLTVAVRSPARLTGAGAVAGLDRIERTVQLRRECAG